MVATCGCGFPGGGAGAEGVSVCFSTCSLLFFGEQQSAESRDGARARDSRVGVAGGAERGGALKGAWGELGAGRALSFGLVCMEEEEAWFVVEAQG